MSDNNEDRSKWTVKQWYEHVGAWEDAAGNVCFGSVMALGAMLKLMAKARAAQSVQQPEAFPERDQSKPAEQQGVFRKFDVRRVDGSDAPGGKHHGCRYFVLDMDHDQHAASALAAYAASCAVTHAALSAELAAEFGKPDSGRDAALWTCRKMNDLGSIYDSKGELVANTYYQCANGITEAHNAAIRALAAHPAPSSDAALDEFPAALGQSPCIEDRDGIPAAIRMVIQSKGSYGALRSLYRLINIWGAEQRAAHPANGAQAGLSEPNMFWDASDTEGTFANSAEAFAEIYAGSSMSKGDVSAVEIQCAVSTGNCMMRIEVTNDEENWLKWEWMSAAPQKKEG